MGLLSHMIVLFLIFKGISMLFSIVAVLIYITTNCTEGSLFPTPSPSFIVCRFFDDGHSDWCEMIFHCSFHLHFSNNEQCGASFHVFVVHLYVFFGEISGYVFCPFFIWVVCFSAIELHELLVY